jgi:hypothetical protein
MIGALTGACQGALQQPCPRWLASYIGESRTARGSPALLQRYPYFGQPLAAPAANKSCDRGTGLSCRDVLSGSLPQSFEIVKKSQI